MLTLLITSVALSVGAEGQLEILNHRGTYGYLGPTRPRTGALPGDVIHFAFDIKGLQLDANGRASYSIAVEVCNAKGEVVYDQKPYNRLAQNSFGGDTLPCAAHLEVPSDAPPGEYVFHVTIQDRLGKRSAKFTGKGKILPLDFGLVQIGTFSDREGNYPAPAIGVVGESVYINFAAIGFKRDSNSHQPDIKVSLRLLDDKGQPTTKQPLNGRVNADVPKDAATVPMHFGLTMNRAGRFTLELTAHDQISGKTTKVTFPIRVLSPE